MAKFQKRIRQIRVSKTHPLLNVEQILGGCIPVDDPRFRGIYFLIRNNVIVYVGQSRQMHVRVHNHRLDAQKEFDRFAMHTCPARLLNKLERYYIQMFKPEYNSDLHINFGPELKNSDLHIPGEFVTEVY